MTRRKIHHQKIDGYPYFITLNIHRKVPVFTQPAYILSFLDSLNFYRHVYEIRLNGYVIMTDHSHLLIHPETARSIPPFLRDLKSFTAKRLVRQAKVEGNLDLLSKFQKGAHQVNRTGYKVWQDDYWDEVITTQRGLLNVLDYLHENPVKAGLVASPDQYLYSSYRNYFGNPRDCIMHIDRIDP